MTNNNTAVAYFSVRYYRHFIFIATGLTILCVFWFGSRYPQLLTKAAHVGQVLPSMAYGSEMFSMASAVSLVQKIIFGAANWLNGMKIGMTFGVLFGALLHTVLRYYPMKIGNNLYLNSLKGALIGIPMGVCANCAVPAACGLTRGHGRVEAALGFLFSSPNFNPIVMAMTFTALPLSMGLIKYAVLLFVILVVVPFALGHFGQKKSTHLESPTDADTMTNATPHTSTTLSVVLKTLAIEYLKNIWMLAKPTMLLMLLASVVASSLMVMIPWQEWLSVATPTRLAVVSLISVFMPVPIALDVMYAAQLQQQGIAASYVMLFSMTLGTFSIVPSVYLWREISKRLSVLLFVFFFLAGWLTSLLFL